MPRGKGKRQHPDLKLATMIKKKFNCRSEPSVCEGCKHSTLSDSVPEEKSNAIGDHEIACLKHKDLVIFGVERRDTRDAWEKKRKPRKPKAKKVKEEAPQATEKKKATKKKTEQKK